MAPLNDDGWREHQRLVMAELERLSKWLGKLAEGQQKIRIEIAMLKVKAGEWGLLAGAIPVVILLALEALKR